MQMSRSDFDEWKRPGNLNLKSEAGISFPEKRAEQLEIKSQIWLALQFKRDRYVDVHVKNQFMSAIPRANK